MAAPRVTPSLAIRGSEGIQVFGDVPRLERLPNFPQVATRSCKVMFYSDDGSLFAFCDGEAVRVLRTEDFRLMMQIDRPRTTEIIISPNNSLIATWEPYYVTKDNPQGTQNLNIWDVATARHVRGFCQKKHAGWEPQWSIDEAVCGRNVNNEVQFFEGNNFEFPAQKLHLQKVTDFKLSNKTSPPYHVAAYVPGVKSTPSYVRIYQYPKFGGPQAALANKSFYKADKVELSWNNKGTELLVLTATESSADSYYGDQGLHFMSTGDHTCLVPRAKNGPVYSIEWNPKSTDFCVVYGFMPAKATLYNLKCEPVFDFGTGPRNIVYYNPHGTVLCLAGFGNLGGNMEFWDLRGQKLISKTIARDSTYFEWCPDGKHIVTATTSPRLRVGNGFKLWDFSGVLLMEQPVGMGEELWDVTWQAALRGFYPEPRLPFGASQAAAAKQEAAPKAYVPPAMRNNPQSISKPKYREAYEPPSNLKTQQVAPESMSKAALKNKKKREAKARAKSTAESEAAPDGASGAVPVDVSPPSAAHPSGSTDTPTLTGDPEKDKKIRNLHKKIRQIQQLKQQQATGKHLEVNQVEKIKSEASLLDELNKLQLG